MSDAPAPVPTPSTAAWSSEGQLPPRPRRRLLAPLPVALLCVLLTACGFIGGVLVEKGEGGEGASSGAGGAGGLAARLASLGGGGGTGAGASGSSGAAGTAAAGRGLGALAGGGGATAGQVTFVQGSTLYVATAEGNTVKVLAPAGTTVTKTVSSSTHAIHPGETVLVTGTTGADGAVTAESIRAGNAGLGRGPGALFGGAGGSGSSTTRAGGGQGGQTLFGPG